MQARSFASNGTRAHLGPVQIGLILTAVATALIHFYLNVLLGEFSLLFTLNGLGYLGLLAALFLPIPLFVRFRPVIRVIMILYTLVTIIAWLAIGMRSTIGYVDKLIEVALVVFLWLDRPRG
jgi:hypothetical protein